MSKPVWGSELDTGEAHVRPYPNPPRHARWGETWEYPALSPLWWDGTKWSLPEEPSPAPYVTISEPPFQMRATGIHHRGRYVEMP